MSKPFLLKDFVHFPGIVFDVRTPAEFEHAHLPGAFNVPLFTNEERAAVGTFYKQKGKQAAIDLGLQITGPKLADIVRQAKDILKGDQRKNFEEIPSMVYCWRGGMRSSATSWLFNFAGINNTTLLGGYKAFRKKALESFSKKYSFIVLGGLTGSGKTEILQFLREKKEQVLDLESLANHRGGSYGTIGQSALCPSTEHFENRIALCLASFDDKRPIWVEDESRLIGSCHIPTELFKQTSNAPLLLIETSYQDRLERLLNMYGKADFNLLIQATKRISKQLGGQRTKEILKAIEEEQLEKAIAMVLSYYDSAYEFSLSKRNPQPKIITDKKLSPREWTEHLLKCVNTFIKL